MLDTSVLLSDPWALFRFDEHEVVVPLVVISELEAKRNHPELGWFARQALRLLDELRLEHGRLDEPIPVNDEGGTLRVELNHTDPSVLPAGMQPATTTTASWPCARNLAAEGTRRDRGQQGPPAARQGRLGRPAAPTSTAPSWPPPAGPGSTSSRSGRGHRRALRRRRIDLDAARDLPCNTGVVLLRRQLGARPGHADKRVHLVRGDREVFGLRGRSAEQRVALDLLLDSVGIVLARRQGRHRQVGAGPVRRPGGGAGAPQHRKVVVFRPLYAVGGQDLGYLPGTESEKMGPWAQAVFDTLGGGHGARGASRRCSPAACSRCCRSPTSAAARCTTRS